MTFKHFSNVLKMSVNKFGSSSKFDKTSNIDKKYVDSKFTTLTRNLETKLDKSGGTLTGDIDVNKYRIINVKNPQELTDAINMDYAAKLIKQQRAQIESATDGKYSITTSDDGGLSNTQNKLSIKLDTTPTNSLSLSTNGLMNNGLKYPFIHDLNVSNKRIYFVGDPINPQDAVNKRYLDAKRVKNNVGFIPRLYGKDKSKQGFVVSTNSQLNSNSVAESVFNEGYEWSTAGIQENAWVQIQLPFEVSVWKITIAGKNNNLEKWYNWKFEGSNDANSWTVLKQATNEYLGSTIKTSVLNNPSKPFLYYRFYGVQGEPTNPGLSHLQIYTVDDLV